jgi:NADH-quinone oxidoreductase subunit J
MVLFLFVVMMLDIRFDTVRKGFWKHFPLAAFIGALVAFEMAAVLMTGFRGVEEPKAVPALVDAAGQVLPYSNTQALGRLMYTEYLYPVEIAAVILLVAMISAIALTLRQRKDVKAGDATAQLRARASDRLVVLKMPTTQAPQPPADDDAGAQEKKA